MFEQFIGTKPVEDRHRIDVAALEEYLQLRVRGIEQFKGGQSNPTYRITAADGRRFVLRRKPPGKLLPSAHAVEREYRVIQALHPRDSRWPGRTLCARTIRCLARPSTSWISSRVACCGTRRCRE